MCRDVQSRCPPCALRPPAYPTGCAAQSLVHHFPHRVRRNHLYRHCLQPRRHSHHHHRSSLAVSAASMASSPTSVAAAHAVAPPHAMPRAPTAQRSANHALRNRSSAALLPLNATCATTTLIVSSMWTGLVRSHQTRARACPLDARGAALLSGAALLHLHRHLRRYRSLRNRPRRPS